MANEITNTSLQHVSPVTVAGMIIEGYDKSTILPRVRLNPLGVGQGYTSKFGLQPTPSVADIAQGTAASNTAWAPTSASGTVSEYGILVAILDIAIFSSVISVDDILANLIRRNYEKMDSELAELFTSFPSIVQSSSTMTADDYLTALSTVALGTKSAAIGDGNWTVALHTTQWFSLMNDLQNNGDALAATRVMSDVAEGRLGSLFGAVLAVTAQVPEGATPGETDKVGAAFHRDALVAAVQQFPKIVEEKKADAGGGQGSLYSVNFRASFHLGRSNFGCQLHSD